MSSIAPPSSTSSTPSSTTSSPASSAPQPPQTARIVLVAAVARNGVIGRDNTLIWRLPEDLKRFKQLTLGHPIVMGRKTFESIGRPLPGRRNIVITRQANWLGGRQADGVERASSLEQALAMTRDAPRVCIIGGEQIYRLALPLADALELTEIDADFDGDAFLPANAREGFAEVARQTLRSDAGWNYHFVSYRRMPRA